MSNGRRFAFSDGCAVAQSLAFGHRQEISGIRDLTKGATVETFAASWPMTRAVQHALLIISEAARNVPERLKATRPEVPWQQIHGLGNLLRHEYRRIDSEILWSVIVDHLDTLDAAAAAMHGSEQDP